MNTFNLKIVSVDNIVVDEAVTYCAVVTPKGKIGFKAHHEAFVSTLEENSKIEYRFESGESKDTEIANGLFSFKENSCTILALFKTHPN